MPWCLLVLADREDCVKTSSRSNKVTAMMYDVYDRSKKATLRSKIWERDNLNNQIYIIQNGPNWHRGKGHAGLALINVSELVLCPTCWLVQFHVDGRHTSYQWLSHEVPIVIRVPNGCHTSSHASCFVKHVVHSIVLSHGHVTLCSAVERCPMHVQKGQPTWTTETQIFVPQNFDMQRTCWKDVRERG